MSDRLIVKQNIPSGSGLAYARGQSIDADAVKRNGWEDFVVSANTKEARQIVAEVTGEPLAEDEPKQAKSNTESKG